MIIIKVIGLILAICEVVLLCLAIRYIKFPWHFYDIELKYQNDEEKLNSELNKAKADDRRGTQFLIGSVICWFLATLTLIIV